jgi:hypothetical protein
MYADADQRGWSIRCGWCLQRVRSDGVVDRGGDRHTGAAQSDRDHCADLDAFSDGDSISHTDPIAYRYADGDAHHCTEQHSDRDTHTNVNRYSDSNSDSDQLVNTHTHTHPDRDTNVNPNINAGDYTAYRRHRQPDRDAHRDDHHQQQCSRPASRESADWHVFPAVVSGQRRRGRGHRWCRVESSRSRGRAGHRRGPRQ